MAAARAVELGFVQEAEAWRLRSAQFPSKAGGRPAWLGEVGVPGPAEMQCGVCGNPLAFLLQVYAPCAGNFHRTLLLFCCRRASCHRSSENRCFTVFRSQLPRKNNTYPYDPPPETPSPDCANCNIFQLKSGLHLCLVCGCLGPKACARCHKAHYCSKEHQTTDWKLQHKKLCGEESNASSAAVPNHGFLFPEYEIVTEPEELDSDSRSQDEEEDAEVVTSAVIESCVGGLDEQELEAMAKHETKDDMVFNSFKRRIALEPEQVLRYCRGGEPLWISHQNVPAEEEIPNCPCGAKRIFEFQVMPQLLNHLKVDSLGESIDWGILAVFTCTDNCTTETRYAVEFLWKQDIVGDTM